MSATHNNNYTHVLKSRDARNTDDQKNRPHQRENTTCNKTKKQKKKTQKLITSLSNNDRYNFSTNYAITSNFEIFYFEISLFDLFFIRFYELSVTSNEYACIRTSRKTGDFIVQIVTADQLIFVVGYPIIASVSFGVFFAV